MPISLILFMSSARVVFLILSEVSEESIIRAVEVPILDIPIRILKISLLFFVANP